MSDPHKIAAYVPVSKSFLDDLARDYGYEDWADWVEKRRQEMADLRAALARYPEDVG